MRKVPGLAARGRAARLRRGAALLVPPQARAAFTPPTTQTGATTGSGVAFVSTQAPSPDFTDPADRVAYQALVDAAAVFALLTLTLAAAVMVFAARSW